ncbi:MAG: hypothetical protein ABH880_00465 [Patescibacteria group bacterium]
MKYNPSVKDFLEKKPGLTLIGLFWAGWWRLILIIYGTIFALAVIFAGLGALFS